MKTDIVMFQVHNSKTEEFGSVIYCNNDGDRARAIVLDLRKRTEKQSTDVAQVTARLLLLAAVGHSMWDLDFAVWNVDYLLTRDDSQGDAGVVLIDVANNFHTTCMGGYLMNGANGLPAMMD